MIATFTTAGVLVLVLVFVLGTVVLRRSRRRGLVNAALDYSPTTAHLFNNDDEAGGGSLSRSSDSLSSDAQGGSTRRPSVRGAYAPGPPAPAPAPVSVPAPREMQQQGAGTGFADTRYAYGSAPSYYDPVRQQPRQQQQQQQSPPQRQVRWQQQQEEEEEEWPLPPADLPPPSAVRHPSALIPAYHRELTAFNVPFAATATAGKPLRFSVDGGLNAGKRTSRRTSQVPLPPPPPPPRFPPKISNTLWRVDESPEEVSAGDEDRRNRLRVLKVRRSLCLFFPFARG
jgi:hypothetical protein